MVPIDGQVREGVGLLGSPSFEIPRTVERDSTFDHLDDRGRAAPSPAPPRTGTTSSPWGCTCWCGGSIVFVRHPARVWPPRTSTASCGAVAWSRWPSSASSCSASSTSCWSSVPSRRFRPCAPQFCSIYDPHFWRHERFWKVPAVDLHPGLQRHAVQERDLAAAGCPARPRGSSTTAVWLTEKTLVTHRRRLHAQRGQRHPVPLAGGRRVQVRPHRASVPAARSASAPSSTTASRSATARCSPPTPS